MSDEPHRSAEPEPSSGAPDQFDTRPTERKIGEAVLTGAPNGQGITPAQPIAGTVSSGTDAADDALETA
jgi:hypothetical protein